MATISAARSPLVRTAGLLCIAGGALGAVGGIVTAVVPPAVDIGRFSYPYTPGGFVVAEASFAVSHLLVLAGVLGIARSGAAGTGWLGRSGLAIAGLGWLLLTGCEVWAMTLASSPYPSPATDPLDTGYGVASIAVGVGFVVAGIAVVRAKVWTGWPRYLPLACGVAVFVLVIPGVFGTFLVGRIVLVIWLLMFVALGRALTIAAPCTR
jgi:hypothetical protein